MVEQFAKVKWSDGTTREVPVGDVVWGKSFRSVQRALTNDGGKLGYWGVDIDIDGKAKLSSLDREVAYIPDTLIAYDHYPKASTPPKVAVEVPTVAGSVAVIDGSAYLLACNGYWYPVQAMDALGPQFVIDHIQDGGGFKVLHDAGEVTGE